MKITLDDLEDYMEGFHPYNDRAYAMAVCPFHDDHSPSLQIGQNRYYCKTCGASGNLEYLYNKVSGRPIQYTKKVYNPSAFIWDRWSEQYGSVQDTCKIAHTQLSNRPELGEYLYKRGLTQYQIAMGTLGFLGGYYIFPIKDENNKVQGAVARASPTIQTKTNRYSASKNCPVKLYVPSWDAVNNSEDIYVPFGILDSWTCLMAGYSSITGISGQAIRPEYFDNIRKPIWIIHDRGEERAAVELQRGLGWRGRRLDIQWPDTTKDNNDIHVKYGLDTVKEKIEEAKRKYD